jgi:Skp family chaperone for outer membrane proteins
MAWAGRLVRTGVLLALFLGGPLTAQDLGVTLSPIVTLDTEKVFGSTVVGQQIATRLSDKVAALAAENKLIASQLEAEELDLTDQRKTMEPTAFRKLADAFDAKVQRIRAEQDAKQKELQRLRDAERQSFIDSIGPILSRIARKHGAIVVLERRNVLLSADSIDITQEAIDQIDIALKARNGSDARPGAPTDAPPLAGSDSGPDSGPVPGPDSGTASGTQPAPDTQLTAPQDTPLGNN